MWGFLAYERACDAVHALADVRRRFDAHQISAEQALVEVSGITTRMRPDLDLLSMERRAPIDDALRVLNNVLTRAASSAWTGRCTGCERRFGTNLHQYVECTRCRAQYLNGHQPERCACRSLTWSAVINPTGLGVPATMAEGVARIDFSADDDPSSDGSDGEQEDASSSPNSEPLHEAASSSSAAGAGDCAFCGDAMLFSQVAELAVVACPNGNEEPHTLTHAGCIPPTGCWDCDSANRTSAGTCESCADTMLFNQTRKLAVVRCPNGSEAPHLFTHMECISASGDCRYCGLQNLADPHYIVRDAVTVPTVLAVATGPASAWTPVRAARWSDAFMQRQERMLCYATAASAVYQAFNDPRSPRECAHEFAVTPGAASYFPIYREAFQQTASTLPPSTPVATIQARTFQGANGRAAENELVGNTGEPILTPLGRPVARRTSMPFQDLQNAIGQDQLIMVANSVHWVVVFGYETDGTGGTRVNFFDPLTGGGHREEYDEFVADKDEFLVVG
ncbi:hypothetical protein [Streptacidiphilus melanogenes]|uniref:hypothetical protein n=1 Tax=Streptacidiphilus melanogenes TaxID=411235 RepID=UPI0005AA46A2|nr:hypothetical protein [Streptacidiphilus melanogenes]